MDELHPLGILPSFGSMEVRSLVLVDAGIGSTDPVAPSPFDIKNDSQRFLIVASGRPHKRSCA